MGTCDNPDCDQHGATLASWQTHEITVVVDGVAAQVQRYCRACTDQFMVGPLKMPRHAPVIETLPDGSEVVTG